MSRSPAVAGRFYPGEQDVLKDTVTELLENYNPPKIENCIAVVSPHAGYVYSGTVCAQTLKSITIPETVVVLGPNHQGRGASIALSTQDWDMPTGKVPVNRDFSEQLLQANPEVTADESAHQYEHSLEVQVPFLQVLQDNLSIVPLALSQLSYLECENLANSLADTISQYGKPVLMLASSDMSHFESRENTVKKDTLALEQLTALNPKGLFQTVRGNRISMCGVIPVTVVLLAALRLGANKAEVIRYIDSGEVSGDTDQVVGYAGAVISRG